MHTSRSLPLGATRALVLGGGGSAGNAWLLGVIAGLTDTGLDATGADLIIGTSAGSTAAAQITGAAPSALLTAILEAPTPPAPNGPAPGGSNAEHIERAARLIAASADAADMRVRMGAAAIERATASPEAQTRWRRTVASRLPSPGWPARRVVITAVDAQTGDPVLFDRESGVDLADAVAASCASGFAYRVGDRLCIDGGYRSNADNADLAAGCDTVLVLSPFGGETLTPPAWGLDLATQVRELRAGGSRVETIFPDAAARAAYGDNVMDPSTRPPAARAGYAQGLEAGPRLREFWNAGAR